MIKIVAFDADDTLWHNETLFLATKDKFTQLLAPYHSASWIEERLYETELRNLRHYGYGIKSFTLSMIETAIELTEGRIKGSEIQEIVAFAKEMVNTPVELLDHVETTIASLAKDYNLMVVTKGDLFDQESKIARSGLGDHFIHVEVVTEKDKSTYEGITRKLGIEPGEFVMVGNSLKSDILPVVEAGGQAVHVPYLTEWQHEAVPDHVADSYKFHRADNIRDVPAIVTQLAGH